MNNAALYEAVKTGQVDVYVDYTSSIYYQLPDPSLLTAGIPMRYTQ